MLRDVPYCKSILACGFGGLILSVVMLTWVYPIFCHRVSQVKQTKVRDYMEDRYGISEGSVSMFTVEKDTDRELSKTVSTNGAAKMPTDSAESSEDRANMTSDIPSAEDALPPPTPH